MATREAVTYLRVSGDSQVEGDGFPRQREAVARRARAMRYRIVQEFTDEGVSGTKPLAERPGLSALLDRVLGNGVRLILVEKADRLARDLVESELILREFRRHSIRVVEAESGNDLTADGADNPTASLIRQVLGAVSQFEKSALVAKLAASRKRVRESGRRCDGIRPFGMLDGEQETLKLIFELHKRDPLTKKRRTPGEIAKELTKRRVKTRSGAAWSPVVVRTILKRGRKPDRPPRRVPAASPQIES